MVDKRTLVLSISMVALLFSQQSLGQVCNCTCNIHHEVEDVCDELIALHNKVLVNDQQILHEWIPAKEFVKDLQDNFEKRVKNVVTANTPMELRVTPIPEDFADAMDENLSNLTKRISQLENNATRVQSFIKELQEELGEEKKARNKLGEGLVEEQNSRVKLEEMLKEEEKNRVKLEEMLREEEKNRKELEEELIEEQFERRALEEKVSEEKKFGRTLADGLAKERDERINLQRELIATRLRVENMEAMISSELEGRKRLEKLLLEGQNKTKILEEIIKEDETKITNLEMQLEERQNEILKLKDGLGTNAHSIKNVSDMLSGERNRREALAEGLEKEQNKIMKLEEELKVEQKAAEEIKERFEHLENALFRDQNDRSMFEDKISEGEDRIKTMEEGIAKEQDNIEIIKKLLQEEDSKRKLLEDQVLNEITSRKALEDSFKEERTKSKKLEEGLVQEQTSRKVLEDNLNETRNTVISFGNQIVQFSDSAKEIVSMLPEDLQFVRSSLVTELNVFSRQMNIDTDNLLLNTKYSKYSKVPPTENLEINRPIQRSAPSMFGDITSQSKDRGNPVARDYLPYSCTVLSNALLEFAAINLNENEETKRKGLREMRKFIKDELKIPVDTPDNHLLCFLRSRKFDVEKACQLMRKGIEFFDSNRRLFQRRDPETVRRLVESKLIGFLPYRDAKGRAILLLRAECWNPGEMKADDVIFGSIVALHVAAENEVNQVAGFVVIVDFKNLSLQHIICMGGWIVFGIQALQRCCPCLVKEFHVVHTQAIFRTVWKLTKPLLSEKIRKRITFYKSSNWDSLHRKIPPAILPEELGGQLGPYCYKHWASDIAAIEKNYSDKVQTFLSLRNTS